MNSPGTKKPLGMIAGTGSLPLYIANKVEREQRKIFIIGIDGTTPNEIEKFDHCWIKWGEVNKLFKQLKQSNVEEVVIIGGVKRPEFKNIQFDFGFIRNLPFILSLTMGGDDTVLSNIVKFFESKGLKIIGAHEVAPELTAPKGLLTKKKPSETDISDIKKGIRTVQKLGEMDVGQGAVVARDYVLCVEAAEGTDQMLERAKGLRQWGKKWFGRRFGVFVKLPKPNQELRVDMPAIGPNTIEKVAEANLAGICLASGGVLIAEREKTIDLANKLGIFIIGVDPEEFLNSKQE